MAQQFNPARERARGIVPKMIELSEQAYTATSGSDPGSASETEETASRNTR